MRASRHFNVQIAEFDLREVINLYGENVHNDLIERVVEEFEKTTHGEEDPNEYSFRMYYVRYNDNVAEENWLVNAQLASKPGHFWVSQEEKDSLGSSVEPLYGPIPWDCSEDYFEVDS